MLSTLLHVTVLQSVVLSMQKDVSFSHILNTNQYLLVTQFKCQTTFETKVRKGSCPRAFASSKREWQRPSSPCDYSVRIHLIRDPERRRPPKVLFIGRDRSGRSVGFIEDLVLPQPSHLNFTSLMYSRVIDFPSTLHQRLHQFATVWSLLSIIAMEFTVYDQSYQLLYMVTRNSLGSQNCIIYRFSNMFPGSNHRPKFVITHVYEFAPHRLNRARSGWTEDPYSDEVYYATTNGEITSIHMLNLNGLMSALQDGKEGKRVFSYDATQRSFLSVSGGVLFSQHHKDNHTTVYIRSFENYTQQSVGMSCGFFSDSQNPYNVFPAVMIVRDWEYCQVRDGAEADQTLCQQERNRWMVREGLITEQKSWLPTIVLTTLIALITLLFLLVLYICWLRRSLDESFDAHFEDRTLHPQYYPGQYPDMDVSVDRWNY